jgi:hypothetical protein
MSTLIRTTIINIVFIFLMLLLFAPKVFADCIEASGFGTVGYDGLYELDGTINGRDNYTIVGGGHYIFYSGSPNYWYLATQNDGGGQVGYYNTQDTPLPTSWTVNAASAPAGTTSSTPCPTATPMYTPEFTATTTPVYMFLMTSTLLFLMQLCAFLLIMYIMFMLIGWPIKSLVRNIKRIIRVNPR